MDGIGREERRNSRRDTLLGHELDEDVERGRRGVLEGVADSVADDAGLRSWRSLSIFDLRPSFSHSFFELSHAPPALAIMMASMQPEATAPASMPTRKRGPTRKPPMSGAKTATRRDRPSRARTSGRGDGDAAVVVGDDLLSTEALPVVRAVLGDVLVLVRRRMQWPRGSRAAFLCVLSCSRTRR